MTGTLRARQGCAIAVTLITLVSSSTQSIAAQPPSLPDFVFDLPAGQACPDFDLRIEIWNNRNRVINEFKDQNGNVVRKLTAGKGKST